MNATLEAPVQTGLKARTEANVILPPPFLRGDGAESDRGDSGATRYAPT